VPCLIFKHSTRCNISAMAKYRLEDDWAFEPGRVEAYYLDLLNHRALSGHIAERFSVHHESPQVLLIVDGACTYDASHLDITVEELREALESRPV
jgi:bacillithiol system protein YtxJ